MTPAKLRLAMAAVADAGSNVGNLCREFGVTRQILYYHLYPTGVSGRRRRLLASSGRWPVPAA
jgi:transposase-like protein